MNYGMKRRNWKTTYKNNATEKIMRNYRFYMLCLLVGIFFCGCKENKKVDEKSRQDVVFDIVENDVDETIYGRCGEGTAMHTLELITDNGDTLAFSINNDSISNVKGGLGIGDRLAVMVDGSVKDTDIPCAAEVINLTTLIGKWISLDKSFELQEGGVIISNIKEPKPYVEWKILNGQLVLSADTFNIYELGADSLLLENDRGIYAYKRLR